MFPLPSPWKRVWRMRRGPWAGRQPARPGQSMVTELRVSVLKAAAPQRGRWLASHSSVTEAEGPTALPASGGLDCAVSIFLGKGVPEEAEPRFQGPKPSMSGFQSAVRFLQRCRKENL